MEFVVVAALAFIGKELSTAREPRFKVNEIEKKTHVNQFPFNDDTHPETREENQLNKQFNNKLLNENYNLQPFFKRAGGMQNSNNELKQTKLEHMTGSDSLKRVKASEDVQEIPHPNVKENTLYNGKYNNLNDEDRLATYKSALTNNKMFQNVTPVDKVQVGRGLNTDSVAKGGFHQNIRILPENANSYNKQTFNGRVVSGKGVTMKQSLHGQVESHAPASFYKESDRPLEKGRSVYTAPSGEARDYSLNKTNRGNVNDHAGNLTGKTASSFSQMSTRQNDSTLPGTYGAGPASRIGAASSGNYLVHDTDREQCGVAINAARASSGQSIYYQDKMKTTTKETTACNTFTGGLVGQTRGTAGEYHANMTQREGTSKSYSGNAGSVVAANPTYSTARAAQQYHKREDVQGSWSPLPGRTNENDDPTNIVNARFKEDNTGTTFTGILKATGVNNYVSKMQLGQIEQKLPIQQHEQNFSLAKTQLQNNPYSAKPFSE
jgi:hypothetical protein